MAFKTLTVRVPHDATAWEIIVAVFQALPRAEQRKEWIDLTFPLRNKFGAVHARASHMGINLVLDDPIIVDVES